MDISYSVTIDVPELEAGIQFYRDALGLTEMARPIPTYAIMQCGGSRIGLMEKPAGTRPSRGSADARRYERHWTPVHIDFHVENFADALARAVGAGAICEQTFDIPGRPPIAFCSDPFGNGFDIMGMSASPAAKD